MKTLAKGLFAQDAKSLFRFRSIKILLKLMFQEMDILTLNRKIFTDKSTVGDLYFRGNLFSQTLEDSCRRSKIPGETAIPPGRYEVVLTNSPRFKRIMPRLLNVPGYEGVLIHWGNDARQTEGCLLIGSYNPENPDWVSSSRKTFDRLYETLANIHDETIWLTITGGFPHV